MKALHKDLAAEKKHSINNQLIKVIRSFVCVYHIMKQIVIYLLMVQKLFESKRFWNSSNNIIMIILFYPYSIQMNKWSDNCSNITDPYARLYVSDVVKNINVKVFNVVSRTNKARHIAWH